MKSSIEKPSARLIQLQKSTPAGPPGVVPSGSSAGAGLPVVAGNSVAGGGGGGIALAGGGSAAMISSGHSGHSSPAQATSPMSSKPHRSHVTSIHPLHFTWVFWYMHRPPGTKVINYEDAMSKISSFSSIEEFWTVYCHLKRPCDLPKTSDYSLFKQGIKPVWEDSHNINGGKWIVRLKKGLASRYWESLILAIIGDQFSEDICGLVISIRGTEDILCVWNQTATDSKANLKIRDIMKAVLDLPADTVLEYKAHTDALKDKSSFRNTDVFR